MNSSLHSTFCFACQSGLDLGGDCLATGHLLVAAVMTALSQQVGHGKCRPHKANIRLTFVHDDDDASRQLSSLCSSWPSTPPPAPVHCNPWRRRLNYTFCLTSRSSFHIIKLRADRPGWLPETHTHRCPIHLADLIRQVAENYTKALCVRNGRRFEFTPLFLWPQLERRPVFCLYQNEIR